VTISDTCPDVRRRQTELLRRATPAQRFAIAESLTATVARLSRRALERRHPDATRTEIDRMFAELHYGKQLTRRLMGDP